MKKNKPLTLADLPAPIAEKLAFAARRIRRIILMRGLFKVFSLAMLSFLAVMAIDATTMLLSELVRWLLSSAAFAVVCLGASRFLFRPLRRRLSPAEIARVIETRESEFVDERISSTVEILSLQASRQEDFSQTLLKQLISDAEKDAGALAPQQIFTWHSSRRFLYAMLTLASVYAVLFVLWPRHSARLFMRAIAPYARIGGLHADQLQVDPGDVRMAVGDSLTIKVEVEHGVSRNVEIRAIAPDGRELVERMRPSDPEDPEPSRFFASFPVVNKSFEYRIRAGRALSRFYRVQAFDRPEITNLHVHHEYPQYTDRAPMKETINNGRIQAFTGSTLTISVEANTEIEKAELLIDGKSMSAGASAYIEGKQVNQWIVPVEKPGSFIWQVDMTSSEGFNNPRAPNHELVVFPDKPPGVSIASPESPNVRLDAAAILPIQYSVSDDHGISKVKMRLRPEGAEQRLVEQGVPLEQDGEWSGRALLDLASLRLGNTGIIRVEIVAYDNLPAQLGGPNEGISRTITINIEKGIESHAHQELKAQRELAEKVLEQAVEELEKISQEAAQMQELSAADKDGKKITRGVLREFWTGIGGGGAVANLTSHPRYPANPDGSEIADAFKGPVNWQDNYGTRMHGFVHPPKTGEYRFLIAGDDNCELWLSSDANPANASLVASVPEWTAPEEWGKFPQQHSKEINLREGQRYYVMALQKDGGGGDSIAVAWEGSGINRQVITGDYLSPWEDPSQRSLMEKIASITEKIDSVDEKLADVAEKLQDTTLQALADSISGISDDQLSEARKLSQEIPLTDEAAEQGKLLEEMKKQIDSALADAKQLQRQLDPMAGEAERQADLSELSSRQEVLAEQAGKEDWAEGLEDWKHRQEEVADRLAEMIQEENAKRQLNEKIDQASKLLDDAAKAAREAAETAGQGEQQATEEARQKATEAVDAAAENIGALAEMAHKAGDPDKGKDLQEISQSSQEAGKQIAEAGKQGDKSQQEAMEESAGKLENLAEKLKEIASPTPGGDDPKQKQAAEMIQEENAKQQLNKKIDQASNLLDDAAKAAREAAETAGQKEQQATEEARQKAADAAEAAAENIGALAEMARNAGDPDKGKDLQEISQSSQEAGKQIAEAGKQGDKSQQEAMEESAGKLENLAEKLKEIASPTPGGDDPKQKQAAEAALDAARQQAARQAAEAALDAARQQASEAALDAARQAAEAAASGQQNEAADMAAEAARQMREMAQPLPKQKGTQPPSTSPQPADPSEQPGGLAGKSQSTPEADSEVPKWALDIGLSSSDWVRLKGSVKADGETVDERRVPSEYRALIRDYFRELGREDRK